MNAPEHIKQIAIIRGVEPDQAVEVTRVFAESGFDVVEVPLNSPQPLESIRRMAQAFGDELLIGAGTVLTIKDVNDVAEAGGKLIVSPNTNPDVIRETKRLGLMSVPGVMTPTECFAALDAGADALKLFNAGTVGPNTLKAYRAVLPKETQVYAVGGVTVENARDWIDAGANGYGLGANVYKPCMSLEEIKERATAFTSLWQ